MVHRPPDSRLLSNLISHEKEYTKHLSSLFPISHAALASLSAFAAASPSAISKSSVSLAQTISSVVDIFANADDALQRYNQALESWRDQLGHVLKLEEEIGAILRDREILVTRLIKVSKHSKAVWDSRSSLIVPSGSTSFTSLHSINSTAHTSSSTKLLHAQEELRACEAHLTTKELELEACRVSIAREGLGARCRALIDCGCAWIKMGKEGLQALENLGTSNHDNQVDSTSPSHSRSPSIILSQQKVHGPLSYSSDISSLTPSQSISQHHDGPSLEISREGVPDQPILNGREEVTVNIPPAHAISELTILTGVCSPSHPTSPLLESSIDLHPTSAETHSAPRSRKTQQKRRPLSRRITEEDEDEFREKTVGSRLASLEATHGEDDSSEEEQPQGPLEVVENNPFGLSKRLSQELAPEAVQPLRERNGKQRERERKPSLSFFGSLRGFLKTLHKDPTSTELTDTTTPLVGKGRKGNKGWSTRTNANLKASRSQGSSDSEPDIIPKSPLPSRSAKLRKGRSTTRPSASSSGWQTDEPGSASSHVTIRRKRKSVAELKGKDGGYTDGELDSIPSYLASRSQAEIVSRHPSTKRQEPPTNHQAILVEPSCAPSPSVRDGAILAPSLSNSAGTRHRKAITDSGHIYSDNGTVLRDDSPQRSASPTYGATPQRVWDPHTTAKSKSKPTVKPGAIHPLPVKGSNGVSLMSIVEDVSRQNRNSRNVAITPAPSRSLDLPSNPTQSSYPSPVKLEIPRAPIPGVPTDTTWSSKLSDRLPTRRRSASLDISYAPGSVSPQSLPDVLSTQGTEPRRDPTHNTARSAGQGSYPVSASGSEPRRVSRPAVSPLRSALRNSSRTPSPSPVQLTRIRKHVADVRPDKGDDSCGGTPEREESGQYTPRPAQLGEDTPRPAQLGEDTPSKGMLVRDSVSMTSMSSYVTGRESPFEADSVPQPLVSQPDTDSSTFSHETPLGRRKSVRVSLQPTFSPTPPALEEDEARGRYHWNSPGRKDIKDGSGDLDLWQDSSEEDEEYVRARKLLNRIDKGGKGKKKV